MAWLSRAGSCTDAEQPISAGTLLRSGADKVPIGLVGALEQLLGSSCGGDDR
jgi:hypothetical protein